MTNGEMRLSEALNECHIELRRWRLLAKTHNLRIVDVLDATAQTEKKESPSGGRGISRKIGVDGIEKHDRVWNDPIEIRRTVELMKAAEAKFKSPHYPKDQIDLLTKAKREQWVADASKIWGAGTIHVQLAIARKEGLIVDGRRKK